MIPRRLLVLTALAFVLGAVALVQVSPQRFISADTTPGRLGAALLRCAGTFDLGRVQWVRDVWSARARPPYWLVPTDSSVERADPTPSGSRSEGVGAADTRAHHDVVDVDPVGRRAVSTFGPTPALLGAVVMPAYREGDIVDDALLRRRERVVSSACLGLAAALLALGIAARRSLGVAVAGGAIALASFAGLATLGQGLWQQMCAMPLLVGGFATLLWCEPADGRPRRWARWLAPGLLLAATLVRPAIAPLCVGLGIAWSAQRPRVLDIALAFIVAAALAAPFIVWNVIELGTPLPIAQAAANARLDEHLFIFSRSQLGVGLGGLLVSPARGLLWFAPIAIIAVVGALRRTTGARRTEHIVAVSLIAQLIAMALFYRWWGGVCFGPRLLAESTWIAIGLGCLLAVNGRGSRVLVAFAVVVTIGVGLLGLFGWRAEKWDSRRNPDLDENALWDVADSPLPAIVTYDIAPELLATDGGEPQLMQCTNGQLTTIVH